MAAGEEDESLIRRLIFVYLSSRRNREAPNGLFGNEDAGLLLVLRNDIKGYLHMQMLNLWIGTKLDEAGTGFLAKLRYLSDFVIREERQTQHFDVDGRGDCWINSEKMHSLFIVLDNSWDNRRVFLKFITTDQIVCMLQPPVSRLRKEV